MFVVEPSAFVRGLEDIQLNELGVEARFSCEVSTAKLAIKGTAGILQST